MFFSVDISVTQIICSLSYISRRNNWDVKEISPVIFFNLMGKFFMPAIRSNLVVTHYRVCIFCHFLPTIQIGKLKEGAV